MKSTVSFDYYGIIMTSTFPRQSPRWAKFSKQIINQLNKHGPTSPRVTVDVLNREVKHDTRREAYHTNNPNKTNISSEGTSSCSADCIWVGEGNSQEKVYSLQLFVLMRVRELYYKWSFLLCLNNSLEFLLDHRGLGLFTI